tara:strand:+ start:1700 stop:1915 length:216 start_codon:yes stop_codon:yes gene_type:complete
MAKYKAKDSFKDSKIEYFHPSTDKLLSIGGSITLDEQAYKNLPKEIKEHLFQIDKPKKVSKKDTKKTEKEK